MQVSTAFTHIYDVVCRDTNGDIKWEDQIKNLTTLEGLDDILTQYWKGSSYSASHNVGLTDGTPTIAAADTMSSHAGWAEVVAYSQGARPALTLGNVSSQAVSNSANVASFSIDDSATVGGAFITTDGTKAGTSGTLVGGAAFSGGDRTVANGDTIEITVNLSAASA